MAKQRHEPTVAAFAVFLLLVGAENRRLLAAGNPQATRISASEPTALVRVDNVVAVPNDVLHFAEERAGEVFRMIRARVAWVDAETAAREHLVPMFTVVIVNAEHRGPYWAEDPLAFAAPVAHRAWVFWDRVDAARSRTSLIGIVLGDVMAHELGHLILSSTRHSSAGIMRAGVPFQPRTPETFTKRQAVEIRTRLQQMSNVDNPTK